MTLARRQAQDRAREPGGAHLSASELRFGPCGPTIASDIATLSNMNARSSECGVTPLARLDRCRPVELIQPNRRAPPVPPCVRLHPGLLAHSRGSVVMAKNRSGAVSPWAAALKTGDHLLDIVARRHQPASLLRNPASSSVEHRGIPPPISAVVSVRVVPNSMRHRCGHGGRVRMKDAGKRAPSTTGENSAAAPVPRDVACAALRSRRGSFCSAAPRFGSPLRPPAALGAARWLVAVTAPAAASRSARWRGGTGPAPRHRHQRADLPAAAGLAEDRDVVRVAAESRDVVAHPLQRRDEVEHAGVAESANSAPPSAPR